jgi:UDP-N-acetylmuramoyl-tripeptide--D-alanyl-D-alanine ligase
VNGRAVLWTSADAEAATGGRSTAPWVATGVSIDTRTLEEGDLFIAIEGARDGHDFVADAVRAGAAAAVVRRMPDGVPSGFPLLVVADTMDALNGLGAAARQRSGARFIAVTGSVGKTSTKEMLRLVLGRQNSTHAPVGSYNNQWGVPLTLARMPLDTAYAVIEIGMNRAGEIGPLSRLARPHVAIITTVEAAHLEFFESVMAIADAKAEIFGGVEPGGIAILNRDSPHFARLIDCAFMSGVDRIESFGRHPDATARLDKVVAHAGGSCIKATIAGDEVCYKIGAHGQHWAMNSLAVLLAVRAVDADHGLAALALADMAPPKGRGERHRINLRGGAAELIDDSYNANPASVRAALAVLGAAKPEGRGRRIAVLGDMRELGERGPELHAALAADVEAADVDLLFAAGPLMRHLFDAVPAKRRGVHQPTSTELIAPLKAELRAGDVVLVKGSLGSRMAPIVEALLAMGSAP